jgi:hypothetical protein
VISTLTRRVPRPSIALVVAFMALFAALGGTGYAALTITGKNIQNETVTGADVDNKSLSYKEFKKNTLGGDQINESKLGTVPTSAHAANADNAVNAQTAAKAADSDKLGGLAATDFMLNKQRAYEANINSADNFPSGTTRATLTDLPAGTYLMLARFGYHNDGATAQYTCSLNVPGSDDDALFSVATGTTEQIMLQEIVTSESLFMATVSCTSNGNDDITAGGISAIRID